MAIAQAPIALSVRDRLQAQASRLRRVKLIDRMAVGFITLGGLFVIVAVLFIFVFILGEALPLFRPARGEARGTIVLAAVPPAPAVTPTAASSGTVTAPPVPAKAMVIGVDEYQLYTYAVLTDARIVVFSAKDGSLVKEFPAPPLEGSVTAASRSLIGDYVAVGDAAGGVFLRQVRFVPRYEGSKLVDLEISVRDRGPRIALDPEKRAVREVAYEESGGRKVAAAVVGPATVVVWTADDEGVEHQSVFETSGGERVTRVRLGRGDAVVASTDKGNLYHWTLEPEPRLLETQHVSDEPITALEYVLGGVTLIVGDAKGNVSGWFGVRLKEDDPEPQLVKAHTYPGQGVAIAAIGASRRDKTFVTAGKDASLVLRHMTSERSVLSFPGTGQGVESVLITPKSDGIIAEGTDGTLARYEISAPHPEITWKALFGKVWYEGYSKPEYTWQSTGGTDDFETKFSLVPLIFGTIKGTLYALLFAIPVAVMGALYTSQFMHPTIKAKVKPTVEIMAALPSVVVGFIAGLWLASRVERQIVPVLLMVVFLPLFGTLGFLLWDRLPRGFRDRLKPGMEIVLIVPLVLGGALVALAVGPALERGFFAGDFRLWLQSALGLVYDQRNSLVVGLAMGFAVIPIIFTIAEDSFTSVPQHLTAASLALGASRWQTAVNVVLPTASPGIFSAVMIGFGRAVGETMIVLMATGNTPVLDWSIFNGMRTLSANIAVEVPEAPYGGTLYRVLFLAGLALFMMTFLVNTLAELVRQRLRERYRAI